MKPPASSSSLPRLPLERFDGPLDLLLDEVRRQKVAIAHIAMAPIVARYLEYLRAAAARGVRLDIDWLEIAATLIYWKSRSLLPHDPAAEPAGDPIRDDLVRRLLAHRQLAAGELARRHSLEETRLSRSSEAAPGPCEAAAFVTAWDLIQQARALARWTEEQREQRRRWRETFDVERDDVTIAEMMDYLRGRLSSSGGTLDGRNLLNAQPDASHRSCLFLGMLEMARGGEIELRQNESFGELVVRASGG